MQGSKSGKGDIKEENTKDVSTINLGITWQEKGDF